MTSQMQPEEKAEFVLVQGVKYQLITADFETLNHQILSESFVISEVFDPSKTILNSTDEAIEFLVLNPEITDKLMAAIEDLEKAPSPGRSYGMTGLEFLARVEKAKRRSSQK